MDATEVAERIAKAWSIPAGQLADTRNRRADVVAARCALVGWLYDCEGLGIGQIARLMSADRAAVQYRLARWRTDAAIRIRANRALATRRKSRAEA